MLIFLVPYRARKNQTFRKKQTLLLIENLRLFANKYNIEHRVVICEQNDDEKFNRGKLLNIAFLESEQLFDFPKKCVHMNVDYNFNLNMDFPLDILKIDDCFLDLYIHQFPILGSVCIFNPELYKMTNGFPNDIVGWGGDDWAIYNRIIKKNIKIIRCEHLSNKSGFIIEDDEGRSDIDTSLNAHNIELAGRDDANENGLSSCMYKINSNGEFHDGINIHHYVCDL